ncbi:MAG: OmpH family outer membrane protein [Crocinitomicaceae bacterium]|jgi:outer membrane protein|nr:OmpH family outer membrane protein [Crocinitomicaceae bacterium]
MKKYFLLVPATALIMAACGEKKDDKGATTPTPAKVEAREMGKLKIAFYEQDSLSAKFNYLQEEQKILDQKQKAFQNKVDAMMRDYQEFLRRNDERNKQGLLSQVQLQSIQQEAMSKEQAIGEFQQREGGRIEQEAFEKLQILNKKVAAYAKMFSEDNNIDILMIKGQGGQISYIRSEMDVTQAFIDFLNSKEDEIKKDMQAK